MARTHRAVLTAIILAAAGCASSGGSGGSAPRADQFLLTRSEIAATPVATLYDVVRRLRPRWLEVRGSRNIGIGAGVVVYQGQNYLGGIDALKQLGRESAESMRYLDGPRASATLPGLGSQSVAAAIVIEPRGG